MRALVCIVHLSTYTGCVVSASTFEADNLAAELKQQADRMSKVLTAWVETLDPVRPNTMGSKARHAGCSAYAYPTAEYRDQQGDETADGSVLLPLEAEAVLDPYRV